MYICALIGSNKNNIKIHVTCIKIVPLCFGKSWLSSGERAVHLGRNRSVYLASYSDTSLWIKISRNKTFFSYLSYSNHRSYNTCAMCISRLHTVHNIICAFVCLLYYHDLSLTQNSEYICLACMCHYVVHVHFTRLITFVLLKCL